MKSPTAKVSARTAFVGILPVGSVMSCVSLLIKGTANASQPSPRSTFANLRAMIQTNHPIPPIPISLKAAKDINLAIPSERAISHRK